MYLYERNARFGMFHELVNLFQRQVGGLPVKKSCEKMLARCTLPRLTSAHEHKLASRSGLKDFFMRAGGLVEWQFLANNGAQSAVL